MDVNWCAVCERHFEGVESTLYCSEVCRSADVQAQLAAYHQDAVDAVEGGGGEDEEMVAANTIKDPLSLRYRAGQPPHYKQHCWAYPGPSGASGPSIHLPPVMPIDFSSHRRARSLSNRLPRPIDPLYPTIAFPSTSTHTTATREGADPAVALSQRSRSASVPGAHQQQQPQPPNHYHFVKAGKLGRGERRSRTSTIDSGFTTADTSPILSASPVDRAPLEQLAEEEASATAYAYYGRAAPDADRIDEDEVDLAALGLHTPDADHGTNCSASWSRSATSPFYRDDRLVTTTTTRAVV